MKIGNQKWEMRSHDIFTEDSGNYKKCGKHKNSFFEI